MQRQASFQQSARDLYRQASNTLPLPGYKINRMDKKWNLSPLQKNKHTPPETMIFNTNEYQMLPPTNNIKQTKQGTNITNDNTTAMTTSPITPTH